MVKNIIKHTLLYYIFFYNLLCTNKKYILKYKKFVYGINYKLVEEWVIANLKSRDLFLCPVKSCDMGELYAPYTGVYC